MVRADDGITVLAAVREVVAMLACALVDPRRRPGPAPAPAGTGPAAAAGSRTPVVLVHGYRGSRATWSALERRLQDDGFPTVHAGARDAGDVDVHVLAERLVATCRSVLAESGAPRVHLVGHSLGGVVLRYAVHRLDLAQHVHTAVTIAAPHRGAPVARLGRVAVAADLRPGSPLCASLDLAARRDHVRWVALWSDRDVVVPPRSAQLTHPALEAENVLVPSQGHLSILSAPALLEHVSRRLDDAETGRPPVLSAVGPARRAA
jgi:pimeloyl-ACP methyl ester carboxylesterase